MNNKLGKNINLLGIFCLASGAMISSGIFILPGLAYKQAGPLVFMSYFIAGVFVLLGTLSVIELATAMPKAGGDYFFITRSLGPFIGTISSFLSWTALCLKSAFAIFGIAEIIYLIFNIPIFLSSVFIGIFFILLNMFGVKESVKFQVILVLGLLAIMTIFTVIGMGKINENNFFPALPNGINSLLMTSGFVFISFGGLINIASVSGEVENPSKNIPLGMLLSLGIVTIFYTAMLIVTVGVLPGDSLAVSYTPIADAGKIIFGDIGSLLITIGALLAFITTANAGIFSASRYPLALSADKLLPGIFGKVSKRKKVPVAAILITGVSVILFLLLDLPTLVKIGSTAILTLYILTNIGVIILREGAVQNYNPAFKVPFYPWTNIAGILLLGFLVADMGLAAVEVSISIVIIAVLLYVFYGRKKHSIEYGLLHLLERIINKKITSTTLEEELKSVIIERDNIKIDRVHNLFDNSVVVDIKGETGLIEVLDIIAPRISLDIGLGETEIKRLFLEREKEGSTAITPFVAIPHIIIPGDNTFKLLIARSKKGIRFNDNNPEIKAVFALFGTKDERTFHLKVLSAIAHIVQSSSFEEEWLSAKDEGQLKDIVLLSERKRHAEN